jgi:hypothetical protein
MTANSFPNSADKSGRSRSGSGVAKRVTGHRFLAFVLTLALVAGAVVLSYRKTAKTPEEPENVIWRLLDHSRAGSVDRYMDCFTGSMRQQLEVTARGMSLPRFAEYLKESIEKVKGVAVYDVQRSGEAAATLVIEYVYQDQNERQRMILRKEGESWRIESAEPSRRIQPVIPYGKPVTEAQ